MLQPLRARFSDHVQVWIQTCLRGESLILCGMDLTKHIQTSSTVLQQTDEGRMCPGAAGNVQQALDWDARHTVTFLISAASLFMSFPELLAFSPAECQSLQGSGHKLQIDTQQQCISVGGKPGHTVPNLDMRLWRRHTRIVNSILLLLPSSHRMCRLSSQADSHLILC